MPPRTSRRLRRRPRGGPRRRSALRLTPAARAAIDGHARLLLAWTTAINLTAIRDPAAVAVAHVIDSLTALAVLRERGSDRFVDLGSGGGYPGCRSPRSLPAERALLLEPIAKKAAFLSVVAEATGLEPIVEAAAVRAEALAADPRHRGRWPAVTARAVARPADLVELAFPLLAPGGCLIAWKRGDIGRGARRRGTGDRRARWRLDQSSRPVDVAGLDGHRLVVATSRGRRPGRLSARPRHAPSAGHGDRRAARLVRVRIAVLSDIHSNLVALDAVLAKIGAVDAVWHLGDVVGYGPEPDAVVDRLTELGAVGVRGNHDAAAAGGTEIDWFNPEARAAMEWTREAISPRRPGRGWRPSRCAGWSRTSRSSTAARATRSGST